ncbi:DinB family protein [Ferruginibacter sp.]
MIETIINKIQAEIKTVFYDVDAWFNVNENMVVYDPANGGWNIRKVLEHISLTNHFLLILIKKATIKAIERAKKEDHTALLVDYNLDWDKLNDIGKHQLFYWNRPEHMEPTGIVDLTSIKDKLHQQVAECMGYLEQLKNGEGVLYKTTMSVNGLGKIDVYHYIFFLVQHAKRHLTQMEKIRKEFEKTELK